MSDEIPPTPLCERGVRRHFRRKRIPTGLDTYARISKFTATFNPLENLPGISPAEQAQELVSSFKKIWSDSWGVRMEDLLRNSLIALGEAGLTLAELSPFLTSESFRKGVTKNVSHPIAKEYFQRFNALTERGRLVWIEPVMNKINAFVADDRVRQMLSFPKTSFNLREVIDTGKILLVKLDKGKLGDSTDLLGSLFMAKIKLAAFGRSDVPQNRRTPFYLYIDEFQNFAADSFAVVLSEARKYGLSLVMAHQTLAQVPSELRSIILGNAGIQVYFRVNRHDAEALAKESFDYSGYQVKTVNVYRGARYWSLGEEWEHNFEKLQNLAPRLCYVKHKIEGGMILIQTAQIKPAWELLGMSQGNYLKYLESLPFGRKYVVERVTIEKGAAERRGNFSALPAVTADEAEDAPVNGQGKSSKAYSAQSARRDVAEEPEPPAKVPVPESQPQPTTVYQESVLYLEHIAEHPFLPALLRDEALKLSRYKGGVIRQRLVESGFIKLHRVGTGTRSGQIVLLEITEAGYELLASIIEPCLNC